MTLRRHFGLLAITVLLALMGVGLPLELAQAQMQSPASGDSCFGCHERQYLLYDTGKWYCLCEATAQCTDCHGGNAEAWDKTEAHHGMINRPAKDDASICQTCHPHDHVARVAKFASVAGIRPAQTQMPTCIPPASEESTAPTSELLRPKGLEPWRVAGLGAVFVAFLGVIAFGVRCCQESRRPPE